jgi:UPF0755 protein
VKGLLRIAVFLAIAAGAVVAATWWVAHRPHGIEGETFVRFERGTPVREIARRLAAGKAVASPWHFLAARALRPRTALQAGEYRFSGETTAAQVLDRIARGDVHTVEIVIPEGYNLFEIAVAVDKAGLATEAEFLAAARDPSLIRDLAPRATTLEGYLFPDTYRVPPGAGAAGLCRLFTRRFRAVWARLGNRAEDIHQTITLASLVEKETGRSADRATVASVYVNRLARNIKLDCDPTTIYAAMLQGRWRGTIYRSDLDNPHPYNTYRNPGLPPGPIANPGEASIRAALEPAKTPYLFFVALPDGSGGHQFSETLSAHNRAVAEYRRGLHAGKPKAAAAPTPRSAQPPAR